MSSAVPVCRLRRRVVCGLMLILVVSLAPHTSAQMTYPLTLSPFDIDYIRLQRESIQRGDLSLFPATGPFSRSLFDRGLPEGSPTLLLTALSDANRLRTYTFMTGRYRSRTDERGRNVPLGLVGANLLLSSRFGAQVLLRVDRSLAIDPMYVGKRWRGIAGDVEQATLNYQDRHLALRLGRQRLFWGPQPVSLLLSSTAEALDLFTLHYEFGRIAFEFVLAFLDQSRPDSTDIARFPGYPFDQDNRYLAGHRLDIMVRRNLRVGLSEISLFAGPGRRPELYYLNPLQLFHAAQLNRQVNDNTVLGGDAVWIPRPGWALAGQLLIDDWQIDDDTEADHEPNEFAYAASVTRTGRVASATPDIRLEYVRIANRTYHQLNARNRFLYRNRPLGHPLGPDADSLSLLARWWPDRVTTVELEFAYWRHGEGSLYSPWTEPWLQATDSYSEAFPSGVVESVVGLRVHLAGYLPLSDYCRRHLHGQLEAGCAWFENYRHTDNDKKTLGHLEVSLSWLGFMDIDLDGD